MHKKVFIYDSAYEVVTEKEDIKTTQTMPSQVIAKQQTKVDKPVTKTISKPVQKTNTVKQQVSQKTNTSVAPQKVKTVTTNKLTTENKQTTQPKAPPKQQTVKTTTVATEPKVISETKRIEQEEILWNKWRSSLQNKIMADSKLPVVPQGTVFKFSFDVDKYGKISNLQTWSQNPIYTPYAIQYIAPAIRSLQGRSILNFPTGSNRVATTVHGAWKISQTSKYSTAADFNDSERVMK